VTSQAYSRPLSSEALVNVSGKMICLTAAGGAVQKGTYNRTIQSLCDDVRCRIGLSTTQSAGLGALL